MGAIANFILRGRLQALLVIIGGAALTALLPIFNHVSGGALALATLRGGLRDGILLTLLATLVVGAVALLAAETTWTRVFLLMMVLLVWLPVLVTAKVLRDSRSMGAALAAAFVVAAVVVIGFHAAVGDVEAWWRNLMQQTLIPLLEQAHTGLSAADLTKLVDTLAKVMTGILGAAVLYTVMTNLCIGRWLQAVVFNPGGFRAEFYALHLGRRMAVVAIVLLVLGNLPGGAVSKVALDLLFLVGAVYSLQGLALMHAVVAMTNAHIAWLAGVYVLMLFALPQVVLVLSAAGFVDSLMNFRRRFKSRGGPPAGRDEPPPPGPDTAA